MRLLAFPGTRREWGEGSYDGNHLIQHRCLTGSIRSSALTAPPLVMTEQGKLCPERKMLEYVRVDMAPRGKKNRQGMMSKKAFFYPHMCSALHGNHPNPPMKPPPHQIYGIIAQHSSPYHIPSMAVTIARLNVPLSRIPLKPTIPIISQSHSYCSRAFSNATPPTRKHFSREGARSLTNERWWSGTSNTRWRAFSGSAKGIFLIYSPS